MKNLPEKGDTLRAEAEKALRENRFDEAASIFETLRVLFPEDESVELSRAWAYRESGRAEEAFEILEGILERELAGKIFTGFAFDELVRLLREKGDFDRLVSLCERVSALRPDDPCVELTLGDVYLKAGKPAKAAELFGRLSSLDPEDGYLLFRYAESCAALGRAGETAGAIERAASLDPDGAAVLYGKWAHLLAGMEKYGEAKTAIDKAIALDGGSACWHAQLGDLFARQGMFREARAAYEKAVEIDPGSRAAYLNRLAHVFAGKGYRKEALECFEEAFREEPDNPFYRERVDEYRKKCPKAEPE